MHFGSQVGVRVLICARCSDVQPLLVSLQRFRTAPVLLTASPRFADTLLIDLETKQGTHPKSLLTLPTHPLFQVPKCNVLTAQYCYLHYLDSISH